MAKAPISRTTSRVVPNQRINSQTTPCQGKPDGSITYRSVYAEEMARTHKLVKCAEHDLYHNWVAIESDDLPAYHTRRFGVRTDAFYEVSRGKWLPKDYKLSKKKKSNDEEE